MISKGLLVTFLLTFALSVTSFSPNPVTRMRRQQTQALQLHPDQARELEAAACEILKAPGDMDSVYIDDTHDSGMRSPLSVAAAKSSSQQSGETWWSETFAKFISRTN